MNFNDYLTSKNITTSQASKELKLSYETIRSYRVGIRRPELDGVQKIKQWSKGNVSFDDWVEDFERKESEKHDC